MQIYIEDDFNTARVLANLFEIVPVINSFKDGIFEMTAISSSTLNRLKDTFHLYLVTILGLKNEEEADEQFSGVMNLLVEIRKDAKSKRDFYTSDMIRKQLADLGIEMKDEKEGKISWRKN